MEILIDVRQKELFILLYRSISSIPLIGPTRKAKKTNTVIPARQLNRVRFSGPYTKLCFTLHSLENGRPTKL